MTSKKWFYVFVGVSILIIVLIGFYADELITVVVENTFVDSQLDANLQILDSIANPSLILLVILSAVILFAAGAIIFNINFQKENSLEISDKDQLKYSGKTDYQVGFYALMEALPLGLIVTNPAGEILDGNQLIIKMLGYENKEELLNSNTADHYVKQENREPLMAQMRTTKFAKIETMLKTANGKDFFARILSFKEEIETGEVKYFNMVEDITSIKSIEADLGFQKRFSNKLIDESPVFFVSIDKQGRTIMMNQLMLDKLGYLESEVIGKNYSDMFIPERERAQIDNIYEQLNDVNTRTINENHVVSKNGEEILVEWHGTQLCNENGYFEYYIGLGIDISKRKIAEDKIQNNIKRLNAMREIDRAITLSVDLFFTMNMIIDQVAVLLDIDAAAILTFDKEMNELSFAALTGFKHVSLDDMRSIKLYDSFAGQAVIKREVISFTEVPQDYDDLSFIEMLEKEEFVNYYGVPLITKGEVMGVLEIYNRSQLTSNEEWLDAMNDFAGQTAIALDHSRLFGELTKTNLELSMAYDSTLEGWALALELRDEETQGHCFRVTKQTLRLAQKMGMTRKELVHVRRGALLHDIGKMGIPDDILLKPGKLDDDEWEIMKTHPQIAYDLLSRTPFLKEALDIPYGHHEKWDGSGYPQGLNGTEIPLAARIFSVIDTWDALLSDRPYRNAWTVERVSDYIKGQNGTQFDPEIVEVFLELIKEDKTFTEHIKE